MKRIKLLKKDKDKWVEYDIFSCPRCKHMQFKKRWNIIGRCHHWNCLIIDIGKHGIYNSIRKRCIAFLIGKFKSPKKKVERKPRVKAIKVRKVLPR